MSEKLFSVNIGIQKSAIISDCGTYRYELTRIWGAGKNLKFGPGGAHCWIMLNPSTADAEKDDPTIRRIMGFSESWGAAGIIVVNLFALRSTDPRAIYANPTRAIGPLNDGIIREAASHSRRVFAAWGAHGSVGERDKAAIDLLRNSRVECLGLTNGGHPKHPLYVRADTVPIGFL